MSASKTSPRSAKVARAKPQTGKAATPTLLAGRNSQIAKGEGDAPVQAYIAAAMPRWKREIGRRLDALIVKAAPGVHKAVKWNSPLYGVEGRGWFLDIHCFAKAVKVAFFQGRIAKPHSARRVQERGHPLLGHPRERRTQRTPVHRLGRAGEPIGRRM